VPPLINEYNGPASLETFHHSLRSHRRAHPWRGDRARARRTAIDRHGDGAGPRYLECADRVGSLRRRDKLNKGVQAYKANQTDRAIEDFKEAKDFDPSLTNARLYFATAYATQYIRASLR